MLMPTLSDPQTMAHFFSDYSAAAAAAAASAHSYAGRTGAGEPPAFASGPSASRTFSSLYTSSSASRGSPPAGAGDGPAGRQARHFPTAPPPPESASAPYPHCFSSSSSSSSSASTLSHSSPSPTAAPPSPLHHFASAHPHPYPHPFARFPHEQFGELNSPAPGNLADPFNLLRAGVPAPLMLSCPPLQLHATPPGLVPSTRAPGLRQNEIEAPTSSEDKGTDTAAFDADAGDDGPDSARWKRKRRPRAHVPTTDNTLRCAVCDDVALGYALGLLEMAAGTQFPFPQRTIRTFSTQEIYVYIVKFTELVSFTS